VSKLDAGSAMFLQSLAMYAHKLGHLDSRFEKLVKLSAVNLTPFVYTVITYVQVLTVFAFHLFQVLTAMESCILF
jgi:FANCI solenoid 4